MRKRRNSFRRAMVLLWALCLWAESVDAAVIGEPYLQGMSTTSMTVMWITDAPAPGRLVYGQTPNADTTVAGTVAKLSYKAKYAAPVDRWVHKAVLKDLKPGTRYSYRVECQGRRTKSALFRTLNKGTDRFEFILYGDNRTYVHRHKQVLANFSRHPSAAFIINTGDISRRSGDYLFVEKEYFLPLRDVLNGLPSLICVGNHDRSGFGVFEQLFDAPRSSRWYSFDCGGVHFTFLYSDASRRELSKMLSWLRKDLDSPKARGAGWRIVVSHRPLFNLSAGAEGRGREDVLPILREKGVEIVFNGHAHGYQRFLPLYRSEADRDRPITCIVAAGGGATLRDIRDRTGLACGVKGYNYSVVRVDPRRFEIETFDENGKRFDHLVIEKAAGRLHPDYVAKAFPESRVVAAMEAIKKKYGDEPYGPNKTEETGK